MPRRSEQDAKKGVWTFRWGQSGALNVESQKPRSLGERSRKLDSGRPREVVAPSGALCSHDTEQPSRGLCQPSLLVVTEVVLLSQRHVPSGG